MLVAKNKEQQLIQLTLQEDRQALKQLRKVQQFFCPACGENVQLKVGTKNIPHFAHLKQSACQTQFSERETPTHLQGKAQLFQWLKRFGTPQLEAYIPDIQQRPDILYHDVAIEFQYSRLSIERFNERNDGYNQKDMSPLWIPYSDVYPRGIRQLTIPYDRQKYIRNRTMMAYNPHAQQFMYYTSIVSVSKTQFLTKMAALPLHLQTWPCRAPQPLQYEEFLQYMTLWRMHRKRTIHYYSRYRRGVQDPLLKFMYDHQLQFETLPDFIGVPTDFEHEIQYALDWQIVYYYAYYPSRLHDFLRHYDVPHTKVHAYDTFLRKLTMQKETQNDLLYAQFVAITR